MASFDPTGRLQNLRALITAQMEAKQRAEELQAQNRQAFLGDLMKGADLVLGVLNNNAERKSTEGRAAAELQSRADLAARTNASQEGMTSREIASRESIAEADRQNRLKIAQLEAATRRSPKENTPDLQKVYAVSRAMTDKDLHPEWQGGPPVWNTDPAKAQVEKDAYLNGFTQNARWGLQAEGMGGPEAETSLATMVDMAKRSIGYGTGTGTGTPGPAPKPTGGFDLLGGVKDIVQQVREFPTTPGPTTDPFGDQAWVNRYYAAKNAIGNFLGNLGGSKKKLPGPDTIH